MNINTNCNKQFHLKNYKIFRKQQKIYMTFGLVISSNTRQKKANLPNYKLFKTLTFIILYIYSVEDLTRENQKQTVRWTTDHPALPGNREKKTLAGVILQTRN